mmetsp:Transcript_38959/g.54863  ORF Transcript_38959/g.54863 Transcript_38959/m.54863 type:complete len:604 (+) Transcript_38959:240-2051(+)|eukprot:CAMPEP_0202443778 /NCGR_PEP_ID=MMETSP1360-20130828/2959_1 /ASSEMBLY_ACC=CAM_ASM_000848 /TAXON_ID=515479 /ORGANISM="Licmophora paradoxa, Strain CCMP2313" /LENGTH=603 /DNA_ID=CAMNT_0049059565 /DNA_START=130 /DNA_END=1941 /DNA_ORIENTATION=-
MTRQRNNAFSCIMSPTCLNCIAFAFLIHITLTTDSVLAQESPFKNIAKFDENVDFRTNVCLQQQLLFSDELLLPQALDGLNISVVTTNYQTPNENAFFTLVDNKIKEEDPGLFVVILDELARRAGFSWRNSFVAVDPLDPRVDVGKTWGDLLEWEVNTFDLSMDYWARSVGRMAKGIAFPESFYDASIILVENVELRKGGVDLWAFLTPFEPMLWIVIGLSIIFSGLVYWLLERLNGDADERHIEDKPFASIFFAAVMFTGSFEFRPNTNAARIMTFSWSFWALIVTSAYIANLASVLVARSKVGFRLSGIAHAHSIHAKICVQAFALQDEYLKTNFPRLELIRYASEEEVFHGLNRGECMAAASQLSAFQVYAKTYRTNGSCNLRWDGRFVQVIPSGMATAVDTGTLCTSLITYVIDVHMARMKADGFIEEAWNDHLQKIGDHECLSNTLGAEGGDGSDWKSSLSINDLGGIFIIHVGLSAVAIIITFIQFFYWKGHSHTEMKRRLKFQSDDGDDDQNEKTAQSNDLTYPSPLTVDDQLLQPRRASAGLTRVQDEIVVDTNLLPEEKRGSISSRKNSIQKNFHKLMGGTVYDDRSNTNMTSA